MPLSEHEQRLLEQIERALYAEDPKFASTVRGGRLRKPTRRRRLQGVALFVVGLVLLVLGVAVHRTLAGLQLPRGQRRRLPGDARRAPSLAVTSVGASGSQHRRPRAPSPTRTASPAGWRSASAAGSSRSDRRPTRLRSPADTHATDAAASRSDPGRRGVVGRVVGGRASAASPPRRPGRGGATGPAPSGAAAGRAAASGLRGRDGGPHRGERLVERSGLAGAARRTSWPPPRRPRPQGLLGARRRAGARAPAGGPRRARCRSAGWAHPGRSTRPAARPSPRRPRPGRPPPRAASRRRRSRSRSPAGTSAGQHEQRGPTQAATAATRRPASGSGRRRSRGGRPASGPASGAAACVGSASGPGSSGARSAPAAAALAAGLQRRTAARSSGRRSAGSGRRSSSRCRGTRPPPRRGRREVLIERWSPASVPPVNPTATRAGHADRAQHHRHRRGELLAVPGRARR